MITRERHLSHGSAYRSQFRYHPRFGYWYRPHLRLRIPGSDWGGSPSHTFITNSVGARTEREPDARDSRRLHALFIGCSMTAGDSVGNRSRFSDLIEQRFAKFASHNYALSGSGNDQQLLVHEEFSGMVKPDILVLAPSTPCIQRNSTGFKVTYDPLSGGLVNRPKPYFTLVDGALAPQNIPVPHRRPEPAAMNNDRKESKSFVMRIVSSLHGLRLKSFVRRSLEHPEYAETSDPNHRLLRVILLVTLRASHAKRKILMPVPSRQAALRPQVGQYQDFFRSLAREAGVEYVDPIDHFSSLSGRERKQLYYPHDGHLTEHGHDVIARLLGPVLERGADAS